MYVCTYIYIINIYHIYIHTYIYIANTIYVYILYVYSIDGHSHFAAISFTAADGIRANSIYF